ncbi:MAG: hypothetical protein WDA16_02020 [Candidatus Thermoplasmatota archaeon]
MTQLRSKVTTRPHFERYIVSEHLVRQMEAWFQEAGALGVEDVAIVAGYATSRPDGVAITALHPNAERHAGWFEQRDAPEWGELYTFAQPLGMHYLFQIHTHPPRYGTRHSPRDDAGAFSDQRGFVSIVAPDFSLHGLDLHDRKVTAHERVTPTIEHPTGWRVWPHEELVRRLVIVPSHVNYQRGEPQAEEA